MSPSIPCQWCDETVSSASELESHMREAHPAKAAFGSGDTKSPNSLRVLTREMAGVFFGKKPKQLVEREMLKLGFFTLISVLALALLSYWSFFSRLRGWSDSHVLLLAYLAAGLVLSSIALWHVRSYSNESHMTGMMIGMTIGMMSGFSVGLVLGITNGLFVGALAGLVVGVTAGSFAGKCCGIMGVLEGQMAGFMAGPMGAMTSLMMITDHYEWFILIALVVQAIILLGLSYMVYVENNGQALARAKRNAPNALAKMVLLNFGAWLALTCLIFFGPKSALSIPLG